MLGMYDINTPTNANNRDHMICEIEHTHKTLPENYKMIKVRHMFDTESHAAYTEKLKLGLSNFS